MVRLEGLEKLKQFNDLIGIRNFFFVLGQQNATNCIMLSASVYLPLYKGKYI
jgi:hypothetical protein